MRLTTLLLVPLSSLVCTTSGKSGRPISRYYHDNTPKLTLPWGTYEGKPYGEDRDTVLFNNVRFAKPPVGDLRFAAPEYPDAISDSSKIQDNSYGPNCIQANPVTSSGETHTSGDFPEPLGDASQAEDCLFLDVYVPAWALEEGEAEKLPVIVWIFGGAYIFGGKNTTFPMEDGASYNAYDGEGMRQFTNGGVIWVTGNYRLGAYGFLAGEYMEQNAQPNAGLHDQRLLLDWVQKYISQIGGDPSAVNVWGLSAGGGSILHHLTAYGGRKDEALFKRAAMWSTAFQWSYDRRGVLQDTFDSFALEAGCSDSHDALKCLRKSETKTLETANQRIVSDRLDKGMFPFGPAVDGDLVPDLPPNLLKEGKHVKVSSMMLAHNFDEARMFLADWVKTKEDFTKFVEYAFPGHALAEVRKDIEKQYPSSEYNDDQQVRTRVVLRDSTFVCNNYQIYQAYKDESQVYASRYEVPPAQHGSELMLIIWNRAAEISDIIKGIAPKLPDWLIDILRVIFVPIATRYQTFFAGHALTGDPNYLNGGRGINWEVATDDGDMLTNAMRIALQFINPSFFRSGADPQVSKTNCKFWDETAKKITDAMEKDSGRKEKGPVSFRKQEPERVRVEVQVDL